jgi:hypothetical protein
MDASTVTTWVSRLILGLAASTCLGTGEIVIKPYRTGTERRLDNPVDADFNRVSPGGCRTGDSEAQPPQPPRRKRTFVSLHATRICDASTGLAPGGERGQDAGS